MKKTTTPKLWYNEIVKERNKLLSSSKETGDYDFMVAHGLTEALRIYDKVINKSLKSEDWDKTYTDEEVKELCIRYHRDYSKFGSFMHGQTVCEDGYYGCDVEAFIKGSGCWD